MAGEVGRPGGGALVGRPAECELIGSLLARARAGESGSLLIRGEPGVGKTALLEYAASSANEMSVLSVAGTQAETELAFAGLFGLLRSVLDKLDRLPAIQAQALAGALGLAPAAASDRFLVSAATLGLLAVAAEERPVLCVIDDAQWLDRPSLDALVFASRRLGADAVAMLFVAADFDARPFDASGLAEFELSGVDDVSAAAILDRCAAEIAVGVRARLLAEASGNPLALLELPSGLSEAQLLGRDPMPEQIPLTPRLLGVFRRRLDHLPDSTQSALLVCALDGIGEVATVFSAAEQLGAGIDAFEPAVAAGLIATDGQKVRFRHPLVRAALVEGAPLSSRQRAHAALAQALSSEEHIERRVWHQAMAALTSDEEVASALEASARRAQQRGGHASAAAAFQRAAELTVDQGQLAPRLAAGAEAAWDAGQGEVARALVARAFPFAAGDVLARLMHLRGRFEAADGCFRDAAQTLLAAARLSSDLSVKLEILVDAVDVMDVSDLPDTLPVELGREAETLPERTPVDAFNKCVVVWRGLQFARRFDEARVVYGEVVRLAAEIEDDARVQYWAGLLTGYVLGEAEGLPFIRRAIEVARRQGRIGLLPELDAVLAFSLFVAGQFERAYAAAAEGYRLALDLGTFPAWHLFTLARVEAVCGRTDEARGHLEELATHADSTWTIATALGAAEGLLQLSIGHPDKAADALLRIAPGERLNSLGVQTVPDLVEALVRSGHPPETARAPLERFRRAGALLTPARASMIARCEALLGVRPSGEAFMEALALADGLSPFERARTELLYGEWLRRQGARRKARTHLRAAADEFRRLGTLPWQERANAELRATGETVRKREPSTRGRLTPQELQIAQLAAEGYTNPDIAAQLYLSRKTVEYHLGKVFSKLGISGRHELIRRGAASVTEPDAP